MHRFTCKLLSVVCGECTKFKHINKHFNFQIVSSLYSWACSNSPSSHRVLPNSQDCSLTVRKSVQVSMYNHAWSLLWYFQFLMTFMERRRQDAKTMVGSWVMLKQLLECRSGRAGAASGCLWKNLQRLSPFPGLRLLLLQPMGASRAKASLVKLFLSLAIYLHFLGSHRDPVLCVQSLWYPQASGMGLGRRTAGNLRIPRYEDVEKDLTVTQFPWLLLVDGQIWKN